MDMIRRMITTSMSKITRSIWGETRFIFLQEIAQAVNIPDELTINVDQTPSKFFPTDDVAMFVKGTKNIPRTTRGRHNTRGITLILPDFLNDLILSF